MIVVANLMRDKMQLKNSIQLISNWWLHASRVNNNAPELRIDQQLVVACF
jgi:hypothetical protein